MIIKGATMISMSSCEGKDEPDETPYSLEGDRLPMSGYGS